MQKEMPMGFPELRFFIRMSFIVQTLLCPILRFFFPSQGSTSPYPGSRVPSPLFLPLDRRWVSLVMFTKS